MTEPCQRRRYRRQRSSPEVWFESYVLLQIYFCVSVAESSVCSTSNFTSSLWRSCTSRRCRCLYYIATSGKMINEWWFWKDLEGRANGLIEVISLHFYGKSWKTSVRKICVPVEIRTGHLLKVSQERFCYSKQFEFTSLVHLFQLWPPYTFRHIRYSNTLKSILVSWYMSDEIIRKEGRKDWKFSSNRVKHIEVLKIPCKSNKNFGIPV